jgi:hypothetical protein
MVIAKVAAAAITTSEIQTPIDIFLFIKISDMVNAD